MRGYRHHVGFAILFNVSTRTFLRPHCASGGPGHLCLETLPNIDAHDILPVEGMMRVEDLSL